MSVLSLPRTLLERICMHAEEQYPNECCGVLLGTPGVDRWAVTDAIRTNNAAVDSPDTQYAIAPLELVKILREARSLSLEIAGFYHSHPDHPAMWSQTDRSEAHWLGCSYLIIEVTHGRARATNSFLLSGTREEGKQFIPERIELLG